MLKDQELSNLVIGNGGVINRSELTYIYSENKLNMNVSIQTKRIGGNA